MRIFKNLNQVKMDVQDTLKDLFATTFIHGAWSITFYTEILGCDKTKAGFLTVRV